MDAGVIDRVDQYSALRNTVGIVRRCDTQFLRIEGKDSVDLLNRISTNELKEIRKGELRSTILVTDKAKIVDLVTLYAHGDAVLLEVSTIQKDKVKTSIEKFIITEDVRIQERAEQPSKYSLVGPGVPAFLRGLGVNTAHRSVNAFHTVTIDGTEVMVTQDHLFPANVWNLYFSFPTDGDDLVPPVLSSPEAPGTFVHEEVFDVFRIEEGSPAAGKEITETINPLEANLERFVSFTKGCYLGQEVIARLNTYKKLQRRLSGFIGDSRLEEGSLILHDGINVGWITSACYSFALEKWIGLGYKKMETSSDTFTVRGRDNSEQRTKAVDLPFLRSISGHA